MLVRIILAAMLLVSLAFAPVTGPLRLALYLIPYLLVGYDILLKAAKGIRNGRVFDENFLMTVATLGAIAIALYDNTGDYTEAVAVMLFYQIGEWFQAYAVGKSRKNISDLMDIRPDYANIERSGPLLSCNPVKRFPLTASLYAAKRVSTPALSRGKVCRRTLPRGKASPAVASI